MSRDEFVVPEDRLLPAYTADGHVEEGSVHAWLDGAFDDDAAAPVAAHVAGCAACAAVVAEARGLIAGSARVLGALDGVPAGVVSREDAAWTAARVAARVDRPSRRPWWMGVAATAVLAVGGGAVWWTRPGLDVRPPAAATEALATEAAATPAAAATPVSAAPAAAAPVDAAPAFTARARDGAKATADAAYNATGLAANAGDDPRLVAQASAKAQPSVEAMRALVTPAAAPAAGAALPAAERARASESAVLPVRMGETTLGDASAMTVMVTGTVRDAASSQPLEGAAVTITPGNPAGTFASRDGRFAVRVAGVPRGAALTVQARRFGHTPQTVVVRATQDTLVVELRMARSVNTLSQAVTAAISTSANRASEAQTAPAVRQVAATPAPSFAPAMDYSGRGIAGGIARGTETGPRVRRPREPYNREQYDRIEDNPFLGVRNNPLSTFSIDVDRAAYGNVRRFITSGQRPPADAVRIEELVNYFPYALPAPRGNDPVAITSEVIAAPWQPKHQLVRIALQATRIETADLPPNNLVFLLDVSGSMMTADKLPLVKQSLRLLVDQLRPQDRVAIVTYAGAAGLVLPSTRGDEKARIMEAIDRLEAGGSTAGGAGIELAYRTAREHFLARGNNRVILATDGDFNVGVSSDAELERLIERKRVEGTYLTVLGFGTGNVQASKMEKLAKVGNGNFAYVDALAEARKVLVEEMGATLLTVANDVKLQVEFNPALVQAYRLIGYENRLLRNEDFADDAKDAGDIGAGHQVTALYEVVPVGVSGTVDVRGVDSLRYGAPARIDDATRRAEANELLFVKLRYKRPGESQSRLLSHAVSARSAARGSDDMRFAASVASFGMLLRDSEYQGNTSAAQVLEQARAALGNDVGGYRAEFVRLVERWRDLGFTSGGRR